MHPEVKDLESDIARTILHVSMVDPEMDRFSNMATRHLPGFRFHEPEDDLESNRPTRRYLRPSDEPDNAVSSDAIAIAQVPIESTSCVYQCRSGDIECLLWVAACVGLYSALLIIVYILGIFPPSETPS